METQSKHTKVTIGLILAGVLIIGSVAAWYTSHSRGYFCFTFAYNTVFGDRTIENPSNSGFMAPNGMMYYLPEVPALQTALEREGFYIDPLEKTGGKIYYGPFYGPSTGVALREFQKKHNLGLTGIVENSTIDKLNELYGCPKDVESPILKDYRSNQLATTTTESN